MRRLLGLVAAASLVASGPVLAQDVSIRVLRSTFACQDMSDMIRLGLRMADGDKEGFRQLYIARQDVGACVPLREGSLALLQDSHDEQGLHLVCLKQAEDPACFWSSNPSFGEAPN